MRRILAASGGAVVGAAAVLAGHALTGSTLTAPAPGPAAGPPPEASAPTPATTRPPLTDGTATGPLIQTFYGPVRIRVTVVAGTLTEVTEVTLPSEHLHSRWIAANLVPQLRQRVLTAQSADVDVVSGASYTGEGYLTSLQGALDQLA